MQTILISVVVWVALAVAVAAAFSIFKEREKTLEWKCEIAQVLWTQYNVDYYEAFKLIDAELPDRKVMYKTELFPDVTRLASILFWRRADNSGWMPHHFTNRQLPPALYFHKSWGGIIVDA